VWTLNTKKNWTAPPWWRCGKQEIFRMVQCYHACPVIRVNGKLPHSNPGRSVNGPDPQE
jgi:hypothetical protein